MKSIIQFRFVYIYVKNKLQQSSYYHLIEVLPIFLSTYIAVIGALSELFWLCNQTK